MLLKRFILDADHHVVEATSWRQWGEFFENLTNRLVDYTDITSQMYVSTVFLGIDHRFSSSGPPIVFETMVFGGPDSIDQSQWRYCVLGRRRDRA